jgi:hypothetical protein
MEASFTCRNHSCEKYDIPVEVEIEHRYVRNYCETCFHQGDVEVRHKGLRAGSVSDLENVISELIKEYGLIKRLSAANAATEEDKARILELEGILGGLKCPVCGQPILKHEEQV